MKIAIIQSRLNGNGGSQRQAIGYAQAFQKLGHEVTLYTITHDKERCFPEMTRGLHIVTAPQGFIAPRSLHIPFLGFINYARYSRAESNAARRLAQVIATDTDILHAHDRIAFRVAAYYKRHIRDIPSVLMMSDILTKSWVTWRRAEFDPALRPSVKKRFLNWLADSYEIRRFILPHEVITVLDNRTHKWVKDYFKRNAIILRSGLDINHFSFVARSGCSKPVRILMAGIFFLHRRYEDTIEALKFLTDKGYDVTLTLIGNHKSDQQYRNYYKRLTARVEELGLTNRVVCTGEVSEEELRHAYQTHDIYVSPNHLQSWGLAVFEAMASGTPVIVSKTAGASEILTDGANALLVDGKAPEQIAQAIERLATDSKLHAMLSMAGRKFVEENVTWEYSAKNAIAIFEDCLRKEF